MTARSDFEDRVLASFPDIAEPAIYRPQTGTAVATHALVANRQSEREARARGEFAEIRLPIRDVPAPAIDAVIEVGGETWQVRPSTDQSIFRRQSWPFWVLRCRKDVMPTLTGGGR